MTRPLVLVTGSSGGIGRAVVAALANRDVDTLGLARSAGEGPPPEGHEHRAVDLTDPAGAEAALADLEARCQGRDRIGLVNNAARLDIGPVTGLGLAELAATMTLNVAVPIWLAGRVLRAAPPSARVRIVDLSSGAAATPYAGWSSYCASKAALDMAGQVVAAEVAAFPALAGRDVAVLSYAPGVVATAMQEQIRATAEERFPARPRFEKLHATGELVDPAGPAEEIAAWILGDDHPSFARARFGAST